MIDFLIKKNVLFNVRIKAYFNEVDQEILHGK